jgi:hypothetical protein
MSMTHRRAHNIKALAVTAQGELLSGSAVPTGDSGTRVGA